MKISNHRLSGVRFLRANASGGPMEPALIVLHETAGRLEKFNSVNWFRSPKCTAASAHIVIERDGTVTQMVPFDRRAFHAGKSQWKGRSGCNAFSIGIELVGPGKLDANGLAWFGPCRADGIEACGTPHHGDGFWLPFTTAQIEATKQICRALVEEYPRINEVVTHWEISPKRKVDPNPLLPLDDVRRAALDPTEADETEEEDDRQPADTVPPPPVSTAAKTGIAGGVGAAGLGTAIATTKEGVEVAKQAKEIVPPATSYAWPALILAAAIIGAVLLIRRRA